MKCSLGILNFLEELSSPSHSVSLYFFTLITEEGFLISPCSSLELCIQMHISSFSPLFFASLLFPTICKVSPDSHFAFLHFFPMKKKWKSFYVRLTLCYRLIYSLLLALFPQSAVLERTWTLKSCCFGSEVCHLGCVGCLRISHLTFSFFMCKMKIIIHILQGSCKDWMR